MANLNTDLLSPEQAIEATVAAYNSKDAITKIEGLEASASEINGSVFGERSVPIGFDISLLPNFRVWKDRNKDKFITNIKASRVIADIFADKIVYVSTTGSDSNNGSINSPYRSIFKGFEQYGITSLTVYIEAGDYIDGNGFNSINIPIGITHLNLIGYNGIVNCKRTVNAINGKIRNTENIYIENISFNGGVPFITDKTANTHQNLYFKNSSFINGVSSTGLFFNGNGLVVLDGCYAKNNYYDGFGYNANLSDKANRKLIVIEIDCKSTSNGLSGNSNNGSTTHDGVVSIRINGDYRGNANRDIHDIRNSYSWLLGCKAESVEDYQGNFVCGEGTETDFSYMWLDTCTSTGTKQKDVVKWTQGEIYAYNFDGSGTSVGYTPIAYDYKV